ncbi:MAG TPA: hemerythrin domain-containing protein [Steroidobacteraceae bacterium]|nr:hemerythrin domain-containing protein [Steroidobacteraceae bacterium]
MARAKTRSGAKAKSRTGAKTKSRTTAGSRTTSRRAKAPARRRSPARMDAIALLKADHRQVETWFEQFEKARSDDRKRDLATNICDALRVHSAIEEEIFYPAFYEATREEDLHHEAIIEHDGAKKLIAEIESSGPDEEYYEARVSVLSEMIKHHVKEEEQRDGMFAKARSSGMDLAALGEQLASRKAELESSPEALKALARGKEAGKGLIARLASAVDS